MDAGRDIAGLEIRPPRKEEFEEILALANFVFAEESLPEDVEDSRRVFPWDRALCAYDAGRVVGTLGVYSLELTVPGRGALPAGGITWGGVLHTHRRREILSALLAAHLEDMVRRGEPLSVLLASEAGIYPRFGYGPASKMMSFSIERAYARFASPSQDRHPRGLTLLTDSEAAERLPAIYESLRLGQPGAVLRDSLWWTHTLHDRPADRQGGSTLHHVVHTGPNGVADGYLTYRLKGRWEAATPLFEAQVVELMAGNPEAYRGLWRYILETDLCQTISYETGRTDEPLRHLLADSRRMRVSAYEDDLYVRLLDIPRALSARTYAAGGELVLEVSERFPTQKTGRYLLSAPAGRPGATCHATDRPADLTLETAALAAAYLGGESFTTLARAGLVTAPDPAKLEKADAMFSWGIAPHCCTMF
jgi:predicted acetyltransferase